MANIEEYPDTRTVKDAIQADAKGDLNELNAELSAVTAGSGVLVSASDTSVGYLFTKIQAGIGIGIRHMDPGLNESIKIQTFAELVHDESNLGTGEGDGEMRVVSGNSNRYTWDDTLLKWRISSGNVYATAPDPLVYIIPAGTLLTIGGLPMIYNPPVFQTLGQASGLLGLLFRVQHVESSGANGQALVVGENKRTLNTIKTNEIGAGASLASSIISLPAGTYRVRWQIALQRVVGYINYIKDASDTILMRGMSGRQNVLANGLNYVDYHNDNFLMATDGDIRLISNVGVADPTGGGQPSSRPGFSEIYTDLWIWKTG